jgi:hypothetical protein
VRYVLGFLLVVTGYVVIYYRLMVRHFYQRQFNVKESTFGALFSCPPYGRLDDLGKKYARRYWVAVAIMVGCLLALAYVTDFAAWKSFAAKPT